MHVEGTQSHSGLKELRKRPSKSKKKQSSDFKHISHPDQIDDVAIESLQRAIGANKKKSKLKYTFNLSANGVPTAQNMSAGNSVSQN